MVLSLGLGHDPSTSPRSSRRSSPPPRSPPSPRPCTSRGIPSASSSSASTACARRHRRRAHAAHHQLIREGAIAPRAETIRRATPALAHRCCRASAPGRMACTGTARHDRGYIHVPTIFSIARNRGKSAAMTSASPSCISPSRAPSITSSARATCAAASRRAASLLRRQAARPHVRALLRSRPVRPLQGLDVRGVQAVHHADAIQPAARRDRRQRRRHLGESSSSSPRTTAGAATPPLRRKEDPLERNIRGSSAAGIAPSTELDAPVRAFGTPPPRWPRCACVPAANMVGKARLTFTP